jgi:EAL domain-containing protein (putative c-di-GMP-specific phosphodiesterase class I)
MYDFTPPKMNDRYVGMATKNLYQPIFDIINAQSIWVDAMSRWFTEANQKMVNDIDDMVNKS